MFALEIEFDFFVIFCLILECCAVATRCIIGKMAAVRAYKKKETIRKSQRAVFALEIEVFAFVFLFFVERCAGTRCIIDSTAAVRA